VVPFALVILRRWGEKELPDPVLVADQT